MPAPSLSEIVSASTSASSPSIPPPHKVKFGGIDPLGLRQINFDLMDLVVPGVNNVARHIRPFTIVTWAWRRASLVAVEQGLREIEADMLLDFVARIEVIFVWSQFLRNRNADLPGYDVFSPLLRVREYAFGGDAWQERLEVRRNSTALSSAINYGPALKTLGWLKPHHERAGIMIASQDAANALDAFQALIIDRLEHPAFNAFGSVTVSRDLVAAWADNWALEGVTTAEQDFMREALAGDQAPNSRRSGVALVQAISERLPDADAPAMRRAMCGGSSNAPTTPTLMHTAEVWKQVQTRQLFRLAMEALFYWIRKELTDGPRATSELVEVFLARSGSHGDTETAAQWLSKRAHSISPVELTEALNASLSDEASGNVESNVANAIALALHESDADVRVVEREDRLPLRRARHEAAAWSARPSKEFVRHILESWVLAQHVYWSVGRGLADARARGKSILRLKIVLEDGGWTLTPGATPGSPPAPAGDRLETILSLGGECGLISPLTRP